MGLVERIKKLCTSNNTTIKALERQIGISNGSIRHWDDKPPAVERVLSVANTFNVSLDWLVTGKEANEMTPDEQKLVEYYRKADARGKRSILKHAETESMEQQSSTSLIG